VRKDSKTSHVRRVDTKAINWPVVRRGCKTSIVRKVNSGGDRWVELQIGRTRMRLYTDTGSKYTIITPKQYEVHWKGSGRRYDAAGVGVQVSFKSQAHARKRGRLSSSHHQSSAMSYWVKSHLDVKGQHW